MQENGDWVVKHEIRDLVAKLIPDVHCVGWRADRWVAADEFSNIVAEGYVDTFNEGKILITVVL